MALRESYALSFTSTVAAQPESRDVFVGFAGQDDFDGAGDGGTGFDDGGDADNSGGGGGGSTVTVGGLPIGDVTAPVTGWASRYLPAMYSDVLANPATIGRDTIDHLSSMPETSFCTPLSLACGSNGNLATSRRSTSCASRSSTHSPGSGAEREASGRIAATNGTPASDFAGSQGVVIAPRLR